MAFGEQVPPPPAEHYMPASPKPAPGARQQQSLAEFFADEQQARAEEVRHRHTRHRRYAVWTAGALVAACGLTAGVVYSPAIARILGGEVTAAPTAATSGAGLPMLTRSAPSGWVSTFGWSHEVSNGVVPLVSQDRVVFINSAGRLVVVDASTGDPVGGSADRGLPQDAAKYVVTAGDEKVVVVRAGDRIMVWSLDLRGNDVSGRTVALPGAAVVSGAGGRLLVSSTKGTWVLGDDLTLVAVSLGAEQIAMAATTDGKVVSAAVSGGWRLTDVTSGKGVSVVPDAKPAQAIGDPHPAWSAGSVVLAWWATPDKTERAIGFFDAETGSMLASGRMPTAVVNKGMPLSVSADRSVASAGPLLANLSTGKTVLGPTDWTTTTTVPAALFGVRDDGTKLVWHGGGDPQTLSPDTAVPWGVSASGRAIVIDRPNDGETVLGGLEPAPGGAGGPGTPQDEADTDDASFAAAAIAVLGGA